MIRALIVDDEELARRSLRSALSGEGDFEVVGEAANGIEALERVAELRPDVVFLDIETPGLSGLEVASNLGVRGPIVVFVTAYDEYAVRAFEAAAVDYVLKPLQAARLRKALERVRGAGPGREAGLRKLLEELRGGAVRKIAGQKGKRIVLLSPKEILRAGIEEKLVFLYSAGERYMTDRSVGELEEMLTGSGFFRISRGDVVNLEYARELLPWFSGTYKLRLSDGTELDVSRDKARRLKELMGV